MIKVIKASSFLYNSESQKYGPQSLYKAMKQFNSFQKELHMTAQAYLETFNNAADIVASCGGSIGVEKGLIVKLAAQQ